MQTAAGGYLIDVDPGNLDVPVLEDRLRRGRAAHRAGNWALASRELYAALALADPSVLRSAGERATGETDEGTHRRAWLPVGRRSGGS